MIDRKKNVLALEWGMPLDIRKDIFGSNGGSEKNKFVKKTEQGYRGKISRKGFDGNKKVSRRDFLKSAGIVGAATAVLTLGGKLAYDGSNKDVDNKGDVSIKESPKSIESGFDIQNLGRGVSLLVDKRDGSPSFFAVEGGDQWHKIDKNVIETSVEKAKLSGEAEIAMTVVIPGLLEKELYDDGKDRSIEKLPEDILSEEELKMRGVEIIQADSSKLYIRNSAFEKGGILERQMKDFGGYKYGDSVKEIGDYMQDRLLIAVLDSGFVGENAVVDDKYSKVRELLGIDRVSMNDVEEFRKKNIADFETALEEMRAAGDVGLDGPMLFVKRSIEEYKRKTEDELRIIQLGQGNPDSFGKVWPYKIDNNGLTYHVMELTVGDIKDSLRLSIGVDAEGGYDVKILSSMYPSDMSPRASMGDFNPDAHGLKRGVRVGSFPFVQRHEFAHYGFGVDNERMTDEMAWDTIQKASKLLEEKGDDSGYCFVWSLPNGRYVRA